MKQTGFWAFLAAAVLAAVLMAGTGCDDNDSDGGGSTTVVVTNAPAGGDPPAADPQAATTDTSVASLESKTWTLVSYGAPGSETAALGGTSVTATFSGGNVGGQSSCNTYTAGYTADNTGNLSIGGMNATLMLCAADVMTQEGAFLSALNSASAFEIDGGQLEIMYGSGQHLLFN